MPYEDDPRQGKDRPVVVIGRAGDRLAVVPLSSRGPEGRPDPSAWVSVGSGRWDGEGRTSYANVGRVLRVPDGEIRREGATLGVLPPQGLHVVPTGEQRPEQRDPRPERRRPVQAACLWRRRLISGEQRRCPRHRLVRGISLIETE